MFRRNRRREDAGRNLYMTAVEQARQPLFYAAYGVPDTLDGRFEMVGIHVFLLLRRLRRDAGGRPEAEAVAQALFDTMFADMDESLREMGVGDLSVGGKVKRMAEALYGRIAAYDRGLEAPGDGVLTEALRRNLYGTATPTQDMLAAMAAYMRREDDNLRRQDLSELIEGRAAFGPPPVVTEG